MTNPSIWEPASDSVPAVRPQTFLVEETIYATEGQTDFTTQQFTYVPNTGTLRVYVNGVRVTGVRELTGSTFGLPVGASCKLGDKIFVEALLEEVSASQVTFARSFFTATEGQTFFAVENVPGKNIVILNGATLSFLNDYTSTSAGITITEPCKAGDFVEVYVFGAIKVDDTVAASDLASPLGASLVGIGNGRTQADKNAEFVSVKDFGAVGNGVADDSAEIQAATNAASNVIFTDGVYRLTTNYTFPRGKTWTFEPDARIYVDAGVVLTILGDIVASEDQWIFDCADNPTNYSDPNGYRGAPVTTATPVVLGGTFYSAGGFGGAVSVKWFGATGAGFTYPSALGAYAAAQTIPSNLFVNDTKAIRFALTAICGDYNFIDQIGSQRGATGLFFPDGVYTVDDDLFFGGIAIYGRTPQSPLLGCKILQTNADKNLFVVQSAGRGGLGGGGSSSQIVNLTLGYRFSSWQSAKQLATLYFVENKFNLDTYITGCRFNNISYGQQVVWWSQKEARAASPANISAGTPQYGYGSESGLQVQLHFNHCMFDVGIGRTFRIGDEGSGRVEVNDCLFFDYPLGLMWDELKDLTPGAAASGGSVEFKFNNCDFQDIGQFYGGATGNLPNENFMYSRNAAGFYWFNDCENQDYRDGYNGAFNIEGGGLRMTDCVWKQTPTGAGSDLAFFIRCNGAMSELTLLNNSLYLTGNPVQMMNFESGFAPANLQMADNTFVAPDADCIIYTNNPAATIPGVAVIRDNNFGEVDVQPIFGNTNPNIVFEGNIFKTSQEPRGIAFQNYGMQGRTEIYATAAPVSGTWYRGDRVINALPAIGQPKAWTCTVSGTPGTWVSEGNL